MADLTDVLNTPVPLAEAIATLRHELKVAMAERDDTLRLEVAEAKVCLTLGFSQETEASGGLKAWVLEAGAGHTRASKQTHTLELTLVPKTTDGGAVLVSGTAAQPPPGADG